MKKIITLLSLLLLQKAFSHSHRGAISHAPIGVMGDHNHKKGEFMMSLRHMMMKKEDMMRGSDDISPNDFSERMKPQEMKMTMTMLGAMYGLTDKLTLTAMLNYMTKEMTLENSMTSMSMENSVRNIADSMIGAIYDFSFNDHSVLNARFALSLPTGETDRTNVSGMILPYGMQLGSGTFDPLFGLTYKRIMKSFEIGSQFNYKFRISENDEGYALGDMYNLTVWGAYAYNNMISQSLRLNYSWMDSISGTDKNLTINPSMNPLANTENYGGKRIDLNIGFNFMFDGEKNSDNRVALEYLIPLYQNVNGISLGLDHALVVGWQKQF